MKPVVCLIALLFLTGCRVQWQWPLESFFNDDDIIVFPKWTQRSNEEFSFFQKELSTEGDNVIFAIGLPETKQGLVLEVNCKTATFHVFETLRQIRSDAFQTNDPFYQFDVFGLGIRYFRIAFSKSISRTTLPAAIGTQLCSAPKA